MLIRLNLGFDDSIRLRLAWKYQLDFELEPLNTKIDFSGAGLDRGIVNLKKIYKDSKKVYVTDTLPLQLLAV